MYHIVENLHRLIDELAVPPQTELLPGVHVNSTETNAAAREAGHQKHPQRPCMRFAGGESYYYQFETLEQAAAFGFVKQPEPDLTDEIGLNFPPELVEEPSNNDNFEEGYE